MGLQCYPLPFRPSKKITGDDHNGNATKNSTWRKRRAQKRDRPLILRYYFQRYLRLSIIDGISEKKCKVKGLKALDAKFVSSCNELVLLQSSFHVGICFVLNPLSKGNIKTIHPPSEMQIVPCGFFFHHLANEYRILAWRNQSETTSYEYYIYLFGAKMWRKTSSPNFACLPTYHWSSPRRVNSHPAILNGGLHWYVGPDRMMVFDTINEEFCIKPLPFERFYLGRDNLMRDLMVKDDSLCFFHVGCQEEKIDVWILEDYGKWRWVKKYKVWLNWNPKIFPLNLPVGLVVHLISIVSIHKDELVLFWRSRGMFSYNLVSNFVRRINLNMYKMNRFYRLRDHNKVHDFAAYNVSRVTG